MEPQEYYEKLRKYKEDSLNQLLPIIEKMGIDEDKELQEKIAMMIAHVLELSEEDNNLFLFTLSTNLILSLIHNFEVVDIMLSPDGYYNVDGEDKEVGAIALETTLKVEDMQKIKEIDRRFILSTIEQFCDEIKEIGIRGVFLYNIELKNSKLIIAFGGIK